MRRRIPSSLGFFRTDQRKGKADESDGALRSWERYPGAMTFLRWYGFLVFVMLTGVVGHWGPGVEPPAGGTVTFLVVDDEGAAVAGVGLEWVLSLRGGRASAQAIEGLSDSRGLLVAPDLLGSFDEAIAVGVRPVQPLNEDGSTDRVTALGVTWIETRPGPGEVLQVPLRP